MLTDIYVKLLNEGVDVYRPVPALHIKENVYQLGGADIHNPEDELWEFLPNTFVAVESKNLTEGTFLVAIMETKVH